jgi:peptidoglycan/xylan/chitin deacetylase (PgdA/CDA1 family)
MKRLRVFMYHKVAEEPDFLTVTPADFEQQLLFIKRHFTPIRLSELIQHIKNNTVLPDNAALISFDDGYLDNFTNAYPLLLKYQIPFSVFLVADYIGKTVVHDQKQQQFLSTDQLKTMQALAEYGCHSNRHKNLMDIDPELWQEEVAICYNQLKSLDINVQEAWAYTYGAFPKKDPKKLLYLKNLFQRTGIVCAFRIGNRLNSLPIKEKYAIERIDVRGNQAMWRFKIKTWLGKII